MPGVNFPYKISKKYSKKAAYFCMEYAIHQPLKIYSGGLGFLAGSHMRSAYELQQALVGIGMLWSYGYYDQTRHEDGTLAVSFIRKYYPFLKDTGITVTVRVFAKDVVVRAYLLEPETFGTVPIYLLTTDIDENDYLSRTITHKLYDANKLTRLAQSMVLGIGGVKVLQALEYEPEIYHMNEAHPLPLCFELLARYQDLEAVKQRVIFTTHTPEEAGNEKTDLEQVKSIGFFNGINQDLLSKVLYAEEQIFNHSLVALRMSKLANAVSKIHGEVSREMWKGAAGVCNIIHITNSQNKHYWADEQIQQSILKGNKQAFWERKQQLKQQLIEIVADQTGKILNPRVLTIVWARRFAAYKRANLLLKRWDRLMSLVNRAERPIQIVWAGKPYPFDQEAINIFNEIHFASRQLNGCAILTGYELTLSRILKQGGDVWLNTPRITREASGTSGMTAAMNGTINFSIRDGWMDEFAQHGFNCFEIPSRKDFSSTEEQDNWDVDRLFDVLEQEIIPTYYDQPDQWIGIIKNAMKEVNTRFESGRMAEEYYEKMYKA